MNEEEIVNKLTENGKYCEDVCILFLLDDKVHYMKYLCDNGITQFYMLHKKLVSPKHTAEYKDSQVKLEQILSDIVNSDIFKSVLTDDVLFEEYGEMVELEDLEDVITDNESAKTIAKLAEKIDANVEVIKTHI
jgi:nitrogen regulatory protein PII-like uncharacterized protein